MTLLLLLACQEYDLGKKGDGDGGGPALQVTPNPVFFEDVAAGATTTSVFTLRSVGDADLTVSGLTVSEGSGVYSLVSDGILGILAPGETRDVTVTYAADGVIFDGVALVQSTDATDPLTRVDLLAGVATPDLIIDPDSVNFGAVDRGVPATVGVSLRNLGDAPLTVSAMATTDPVFTAVSASALPLVIEAGASVPVDVTFTPDADGAWSAELQVTSDDADGVERATLFGSSGNQPVAVCDVDPRTITLGSGSATWIGTDSYDPSNRALMRYDWTLTNKPSGSWTFMPLGTGPNRAGFSPDVPGTYVAQLVVTNSAGESSEPCATQLTAEAAPIVEPPPAVEPIYLNTGTDLYTFDPVTLRTTRIGAFSGGAQLTDIAIDAAGRMYGVSFTALYRVDPTNARLTEIASMNTELRGLTCLGDGRLIGAGDGVWSIDPATGALTTVRAAGFATTSGDIVALPDGLLYWSTTGGDMLAIVDPNGGSANLVGDMGVNNVYGMAFYDDGSANGVLWGFAASGQALRIDPATGRATVQSVPGTWWGATTNPVLWAAP
jgi:streptogramin lyase